MTSPLALQHRDQRSEGLDGSLQVLATKRRSGTTYVQRQRARAAGTRLAGQVSVWVVLNWPRVHVTAAVSTGACAGLLRRARRFRRSRRAGRVSLAVARRAPRPRRRPQRACALATRSGRAPALPVGRAVCDAMAGGAAKRRGLGAGANIGGGGRGGRRGNVRDGSRSHSGSRSRVRPFFLCISCAFRLWSRMQLCSSGNRPEKKVGTPCLLQCLVLSALCT